MSQSRGVDRFLNPGGSSVRGIICPSGLNRFNWSAKFRGEGALAFPDPPLATPLQSHLFYSIMLEKCQKTNFKRPDVFRILIRKADDFAYCLQLLLYCCKINEIRERQDILVPTFSGLWLIHTLLLSCRISLSKSRISDYRWTE